MTGIRLTERVDTQLQRMSQLKINLPHVRKLPPWGNSE